MSSHDRRGSRPGSAPPKTDAPWLKDRPDLHRTEREEGVVPRPDEPPGEGHVPVPPDLVDDVLRAPAETGAEGERRQKPDQRVTGGARPEGTQPPDGQGDATKARRRPS